MSHVPACGIRSLIKNSGDDNNLQIKAIPIIESGHWHMLSDCRLDVLYMLMLSLADWIYSNSINELIQSKRTERVLW